MFKGFHYKNGWTFERGENGSVIIKKHVNDNPEDPRANIQIEIPRDQWISIIAHLSAQKDPAQAYQDAFLFHTEAE